MAARGEDILHSVAATRMAIDWNASTPWWYFVSGIVRLGWRTSHLLIATLGLALTSLWLTFIRWLFGPNDVWAITPFSGIADWLPRNVFSAEPLAIVLLTLTGLLVIWGFCGGFIVRRSVVELGLRVVIGWTPAAKLAARRLLPLLNAIGMLVLLVVILSVFPLMAGLIGSVWPTGGKILFWLCLPIHLIMAWVVFLIVIGGPLMLGVTMTERQPDAFDCLNRAQSYIATQPVTLALAAIVGGLLASGVSAIFRIFWYYVNTEAATLYARYGRETAFLATFQNVVGVIAVAVGVSTAFAALAATYLLVRRAVDHTEYDEIELPEPGTPLALPALRPLGGRPADPAGRG